MMSHRIRGAVATVVGVALTVVLLTWVIGRLPDVTTARLPGAAGGSDTYVVTATFDDVLDLVPNSTVRLVDVPVGRVTDISVVPDEERGHLAEVTMAIDSRYELPASTAATIRSTSLLGEKYVGLTVPEAVTASATKPVAGLSETLRSAGTIPLSHTTDDVEVEQLLGSLGALLNGGGLQQISTITREMSTALTGHEEDTRVLLGNLDSIVGQLADSRAVLVDTIDATARLSAAYAAQDEVLGEAVRALDPASGVLARQQSELTKALRNLETLHDRATGLIRQSTRATIADLRALAPVATELGKSADLIPESITLLVTYPFADNAIGAFSGVYGAFKGSLVVNLPQLLKAVAPVPQNTADGTMPDFGTPATEMLNLPTPGATPGATASRAPSAGPSPTPSASGSRSSGGLLSGLAGLLVPKEDR